MIEVEVDAVALSRSRFAVSPLAEVTNALEVLTHPGRAPYARRWVSHVAQRLVWSDYDVLLAVVEHATWYVPDFLAPIPPTAEPSIEDEVATVAATPPERVRRELSLAFRMDPTHIGARNGRPPLPNAVDRALQSRGEHGLTQLLAQQLHRFWKDELADLWPSVRAVLDDDVNQHVMAAARSGFGTVVDALHQNLQWDETLIRMASAPEIRFRGDAGVVFLPSAFLPRPALWTDPAGVAMIGYPALGRGSVWAHGEALRPSGTAMHPGTDMFAGRWADLLRDLDVARSTGDLAARHQISASTVSYHLRRLHDAGLVTRRRVQHRVLYQRTARAADTLQVLDVG